MPYKDPNKQKEFLKQSYLNKKEQYKLHNQQRRIARKEWFSSFLSTQKCFFCEETANECLDLHHIDPIEKDDGVSSLLNEFRSMKRVFEEIRKCVCLCSNCHRKLHRGTIQFTFTEEHSIKDILECSVS